MNIFITGTSKGIGLDLVRYFVNKDHSVFGCSRSSPQESYDTYIHFFADVSVPESLTQIKDFFSSRGIVVDAIINNAGIASMNHFITTPSSTIHKVMDTNFFGSLNVIRALIGNMESGGRIINFTTAAVPLLLSGEMAYVASKSAIESTTKILARELAFMGITVNAVGPGPVKTDLIAGVPKKKMQELLRKLPTNSFTSMEDIINVIEFFLSHKSNAVTGQVLYLGGV